MSLEYNVLNRVKALLSDHSRWTKGTFVRDDKGNPLDLEYTSVGACWCLEGAIHTAEELEGIWFASGVRDSIRKYIPAKYQGSLVAFNDDPRTDYEDVHRVIDKALYDAQLKEENNG